MVSWGSKHEGKWWKGTRVQESSYYLLKNSLNRQKIWVTLTHPITTKVTGLPFHVQTKTEQPHNLGLSTAKVRQRMVEGLLYVETKLVRM